LEITTIFDDLKNTTQLEKSISFPRTWEEWFLWKPTRNE